MSELEWRNGITPISLQFDDPYYSVDDGRAETGYVFIEGNHLPARWPNMKTCTITELGFGTGLNFLETVHQWQEIKSKGATLSFISFEQFPLDKEHITKALANWPELSELAKRLVEIWNHTSEKLEVSFCEGITLILYFGDANKILPTLKFKADAWYLDGFSPAKNPELWNESLMHEVGKHTSPEGTFATYTAAGFVKRGLQAAGFEVEKAKGFGRKRDMLIGKVPE